MFNDIPKLTPELQRNAARTFANAKGQPWTAEDEERLARAARLADQRIRRTTRQVREVALW